MASPKRRRLSSAQENHPEDVLLGSSRSLAVAPSESSSSRSSTSKSASPRTRRASINKTTSKGISRKNVFDEYERSKWDDEPENEDRERGRARRDERRHSDHRDEGEGEGEGEDDDEFEHCAICLSPIQNKTVITPCLHSLFCWECIRAWSDQSRKCPLCLGPFKELIYNVRSEKDFQTYHLLPLRSITSSTAAEDLIIASTGPSSRRRSSLTTLPRYALYGRPRQSFEMDTPTWREQAAERALERRRFVYRHGLFAKHVASNRFTGFRPFGPDKLIHNEMKSKIVVFVRRELQVFPSVDVTFLTTYIISIASQLDLRSAAAIRLLADFVPADQAEHLAHEIVTFARSPFGNLDEYDRFVQYGRPEKSSMPDGVEVEKEREDGRPRFASAAGAGEDRKWATSGSTREERAPSRTRADCDDVRPHDPRKKRRSEAEERSKRDGESDRRRRPETDHERPRSRDRDPRSVSRAHPHRRSTGEPNSRDIGTPPLRTMEEEEIISLVGTEEDQDGSAQPPPPPPSSSNETPPVNLSIFGIAPRQAASTVPEPLTTTTTMTTRDIEADVLSSIEAATTHLEAIDSTNNAEHLRRTRLQARLMAEYRTALSRKSKETRLNDRGDELRRMLKERLKGEKAKTIEGEEASHNMGAGRWGWPTIGTTTTTFSEETRMLLLARLVEEKRRAAFESSQTQSFLDDDSVEPSPSSQIVKVDQESALRQALLVKRTKREADELGKKANELKEKLMRAKLLNAKKKREKEQQTKDVVLV